MYPRHLASSEEDLLRSEADDEEQLTPSATSLNLDEVTDDDSGKFLYKEQVFFKSEARGEVYVYLGYHCLLLWAS